MKLFNINHLADMGKIAEYCAGVATPKERDNIANPQGILEYIVNFFTFGTMCEKRVKTYDEFAKAMTEALNRAFLDSDSVTIPERLSVVVAH